MGLLVGKLVPAQTKFWEFTYSLLREFPSDVRLRATMVNLFDGGRMGWGYQSERFEDGLKMIEAARKRENVPAHAVIFLDEAKNELIRRCDEMRAREESSEQG